MGKQINLACPIAILLFLFTTACGSKEEDNEAPYAQDDSATLSANTTISIDVLDNDVDYDGNILSISEISSPASHGTAVIVSSSIEYTPSQIL